MHIEEMIMIIDYCTIVECGVVEIVVDKCGVCIQQIIIAEAVDVFKIGMIKRL